MINLFLFGKYGLYGGTNTFTRHLQTSLSILGQRSQVFLVGASTRKNEEELFGLKFRRIKKDLAIDLARQNPSMIVHVETGKKKEGHGTEFAIEMLRTLSIPTCIFDTKGYSDDVFDAIRVKESPVIVIGKADKRNIDAMGLPRVSTTVIEQPYARYMSDPAGQHKPYLATYCGRVDFGKHVEIIADYNEKFGDRVGLVSIHGIEGTMYTHFQLDSKFPGWRRCYNGKFNSVGNILRDHIFSVDFSTLPNDGGRVQYTTLEAMNYGCVPVVNTKWIMPDDELVPGVNCLSASNAEELRDILASPAPNFREAFEDILDKHSPQVAGKKWLAAIMPGLL